MLTGMAFFFLLLLHIMWKSSFSTSDAEPKVYTSGGWDWKHAKQFHPPDSIKKLPGGKPKTLPKVQAPRSSFKNPGEPDPRREAVEQAFNKSYASYKKYAWMEDELAPVSGDGKETFGGWAATLVDTLDTLWIMGQKEEFAEASKAAATIDFSKTSAGAANMFETTIRHLGGLLSAYDLSGDKKLLKKATELGEMLYIGFDTPNRLPGFWLNFEDAANGAQRAGTNDPSASPASLCLEFTRLSQLTGDPKFYAATDRVTRFLEKTQFKTALPGIWPTTLDFRNERATETSFTIGGLADSLYEYLPKMHALLGGTDDTFEKMYRSSMKMVEEYFLFRPMLPGQDDILFAGDVRAGNGDTVELIPRGQHLSCFAGGMFGLGGKLLDIDDHVSVGERLARGCGWAYTQFPTGVMPEIFTLFACPSLEPCDFDEALWEKKGDDTMQKGWKSVRDARYILRPEAIESIFLLYRMTGKEDLRDIAWSMWEGIVRSTETDLAFSAIKSVKAKGTTQKADSMEVSLFHKRRLARY